ncbi:hypothetical protein [Anaerostipes sp. AF04-45]|uniref:hypothetical protein n=1 Tax=Anaerostipes sp. AF04-45 TaxID=2292912 RepID=UPI000E52FC52|nr:hypothetical protein [Anaerostipes sp. AF04-45]RGH20331.1 hypothetical protein DWV34_16825 [Anaerostipes sp. AF04-45]
MEDKRIDIVKRIGEAVQQGLKEGIETKPLFEVMGYGSESKVYFLGTDISQVATKMELKLDSDTGDRSLTLDLDLDALEKEVYKDKVKFYI